MNTTEIREVDIAELDQVSGGFFDLGPDVSRAMLVVHRVGQIAGQIVGGNGAGPASGGGRGGAGPVPA